MFLSLPGSYLTFSALHPGSASFSRSVANIAPSLHALRAQASQGLNGVFIYRLVFAVRFAEFHQRKVKEEFLDAAGDVVAMLKEVAPKSWWAVVLCDTVDLLQNSTCTAFVTCEILDSNVIFR